MNEYIPRRADVRECYAYSGDGLDFKYRLFERYAEFDRWLAEYTAEVERAAAEKAWAEAVMFIYANAWVTLDPGVAPVENPYQKEQ